MRILALIALAMFVHVGQAREWPESYAELDALLAANSAKYRSMAEFVDARHSYRIAATREFPLGNVTDDAQGVVIELNPAIPKPRRATILIWEMANAYQRDTFAEITRRAQSGEIASPREYGLRMELVEHGSHQLHLDVLKELSQSGFKISEDFLYFLNPDIGSLQQYRIPPVHDYIEAQAKSGHTGHYESWYYRVTGKQPSIEQPAKQ